MQGAGGAVEIRLLGTVEVLVEGAQRSCGGAKQRLVLAALAHRAGTPLPDAELAAALWGDTPPPSSPTTLRAYVSRLRAALPEGLVERTAGGYVLRADPEQVDLLRFERRLSEAFASDELPVRRSLLLQAVNECRGAALADLAPNEFVLHLRRRADELYALATEELLELRLAQEPPAGVLDELEALTLAHPHRERPAALLVTALARAGRHGDALDAYRRLQERLRDDLGLEPSPDLRRLHEAVLRHDPSLSAISRSIAADRPPARRGNVPLPLTSFVGRAHELDEICKRFLRTRLLTITGTGGVGKTRLALEMARRHAPADLDGPWIVELGSVPDGRLVADVIAQAVGVVVAAGQSPSTALVEALRDRPALLLLDDCERHADAAAQLVETLLQHCQGTQILVTSREALAVPGEDVYVVPSLTTGAAGEAQRLFLERAPAGTVAPDDPLLDHLCARLDGIPLALELAAARLGILTMSQLAQMLDDRFAVLARSPRTALPRHRTMEAAVRWSDDLLAPEERDAFRRASVFEAGFTLEDLSAISDHPSLEPLSSLVAKSMVAVEADREGPVRYRLLETLREFGRRELSTEQRRDLQDRHAQWMVRRAEEADHDLRGWDEARAWTWIERSRDDLRAAGRHLLATGQDEGAARLVTALSWYWSRAGHVHEGRQWHARLTRPLPDPVGASLALAAWGLARMDGAVTHELRSLLEQALEHADSPTGEALAAARLAVHAAEAGADAVHVPQDLLARADRLIELGEVEDWAAAEVMLTRAELRRGAGSHGDAVRDLLAAQRLALECGHRWAAGTAAWVLAKARIDRGDVRGAAAALETALRLHSPRRDRTSVLSALNTMAAVAAGLERHADGAVLLGAVDAGGEQCGYSPLRRDPEDAERHRRRVVEGLTPRRYAEAYERGSSLTILQAVEVANRLVVEAGRPVPSKR